MQRCPECKIALFGIALDNKNWRELEDKTKVDELVESFETHNKRLVDKFFPLKEVLVAPQEKPYFTEDLRHLKRKW